MTGRARPVALYRKWYGHAIGRKGRIVLRLRWRRPWPFGRYPDSTRYANDRHRELVARGERPPPPKVPR